MNDFQVENFDWTLPNKRAVNKKIKSPEDSKVYCHESYAQELSNLYFSIHRNENITEGKDLLEGEMYQCKITHISKDEALAQTGSGQTVYIDIRKELRDAQKFNLQNVDFKIDDIVKVRVRKTGGSYLGSMVECFMQSVKAELFEQIRQESTAYTVRIESVNKGGYIVDLSGIKCFLPGSLAAANRIKDFDSYIGKEIQVMIEGYVEAKDIFIVSYKKYINKIMHSKIQELDLTKKYKGTVTGTSEFGVFVEWEEIYTGLIHKTEFEGEGHVSNFIPGDEIEFYIKEIKEKNRLTLTLEQPLERNVIFSDLEKQVNDGISEEFIAKIKHRRKNGALVEIISLGVMALIPQDRLEKKYKNAKVGDEIEIRVYEVDPIAGKIFAHPVNE
jgi:ribosomal protein S1